MPSDRMFQDEAMRLMFGSEDPWDQMIADNVGGWLVRFRGRHLDS